VIVPTRELAVQIAQHMEGISYFTPVSSIAVYGGGDGSSFGREKKALKKDGYGCMHSSKCAIFQWYVDLVLGLALVLDEADRCWICFYDVYQESHISLKKAKSSSSATMPAKIRNCRKILVNPSEVNKPYSQAP